MSEKLRQEMEHFRDLYHEQTAQIAALMKIAVAARKAIDKTGCVTLADCASVSIAMEAYESTYGPLDAALKKEG